MIEASVVPLVGGVVVVEHVAALDGGVMLVDAVVTRTTDAMTR